MLLGKDISSLLFTKIWILLGPTSGSYRNNNATKSESNKRNSNSPGQVTLTGNTQKKFTG